MSTHLPGCRSFSRFLRHFVSEKLATTSIRVKVSLGFSEHLIGFYQGWIRAQWLLFTSFDFSISFFTCHDVCAIWKYSSILMNKKMKCFYLVCLAFCLNQKYGHGNSGSSSL